MPKRPRQRLRPLKEPVAPVEAEAGAPAATTEAPEAEVVATPEPVAADTTQE